MFDRVANSAEQYMTLLSARQKLVASNIANADTPGYRTKDIDFRSEYLSLTEGSTPAVIEPQGLAVKSDGNNVNIDREARLLAENSLRFNIASNFARGELHQLHSAISEGNTSA
jgi:flagellar basal-body rod protein FlgB